MPSFARRTAWRALLLLVRNRRPELSGTAPRAVASPGSIRATPDQEDRSAAIEELCVTTRPSSDWTVCQTESSWEDNRLRTDVRVDDVALPRDPRVRGPGQAEPHARTGNHLSFSAGIHSPGGTACSPRRPDRADDVVRRLPQSNSQRRLTWRPAPILSGLEALPVTSGGRP